MEGSVPQDNHVVLKGFTQGVEGGVWGIGTRAVPGHDQAQVMEQQTELAPNNPAMVGFAFAPDLLGTAPFAQRMEQFDPVAIHHPQDRGRGQKRLRALALNDKETKEARALGQGGKHAMPVAAHPAIKPACAHALEGKEHAQRHDFTGLQTRLGRFWHVPHLFIYPIEQLADKVLSRHVALLRLQRCHSPQLGDAT